MSRLHAARPRARKARGSLTLEAILDAAERVAAGGADVLTMRAVAAQLESAPMALYRYFGTKDDLVDALLDRVLGRFEDPVESKDWLADLESFAVNHRRMLCEHPWAIALLTMHPDPGPNALPIGESVLRILRRGGIAGDEAVATFSGIIALNYGWSSFVAGRRGGLNAESKHASTPRALDAARFPLTQEVSAGLGRYGSDEHYSTALGLLLGGICAGAER